MPFGKFEDKNKLFLLRLAILDQEGRKIYPGIHTYKTMLF